MPDTKIQSIGEGLFVEIHLEIGEVVGYHFANEVGLLEGPYETEQDARWFRNLYIQLLENETGYNMA